MNYLKSFQKDQASFSFQIPLASLIGFCAETKITPLKQMEKNNTVKIKKRIIFILISKY